MYEHLGMMFIMCRHVIFRVMITFSVCMCITCVCVCVRVRVNVYTCGVYVYVFVYVRLCFCVGSVVSDFWSRSGFPPREFCIVRSASILSLASHDSFETSHLIRSFGSCVSFGGRGKTLLEVIVHFSSYVSDFSMVLLHSI